MGHYALAALGGDRPGIVERLTRVLLEHGANVEDSQMGILRGRFSMTLVVSTEGDSAALASDLEAAADELGLDALAFGEIEETDVTPAVPTHIVTAYGADHPGIVHAVAAALADEGCNITDLDTRLTDEGPEPLYVMLVEAEVPAAGVKRVRAALDEVAGTQGVELSMRELEQDAL